MGPSTTTCAWMVEAYQYVEFLTWMTQLFLFTNIALLKCSICLLIMRIDNRVVLQRCLYAMMAGLVLTNLEPIIVLLAQCRPIQKSWRFEKGGHCWPTKVRIYSIYMQVAYSVVTDLICALLPIVVLWKVKITQSTKMGVCFLMSLGLIATAVAIVRASSLGTKSIDLSYDYCIAAIWANTELHLGIIATNLALGRMMWSHFTDRRSATSPDDAQHTPPQYSSNGFSSRKARKGYVRSEHGALDTEAQSEARNSVENLCPPASEIPLDPIIKKTMSVNVSYRQASTPDGHDPNGILPAFLTEEGQNKKTQN
ncbi:hypothetical protein ACEQ8H_003201 [Pleosporales sp. CAS-2024a]